MAEADDNVISQDESFDDRDARDEFPADVGAVDPDIAADAGAGADDDPDDSRGETDDVADDMDNADGASSAESEEELSDDAGAEQALNAAAAMEDDAVREREAAARQAIAGPGIVKRSISWLINYHSFVFLAMALGLAVYAWIVYPREELSAIPPAEGLYRDGIERLYRVINPDLPLFADTPGDEALAARNAFLNLFVFHRANLSSYPQFVNPHLLLAEANRILAEYNPELGARYYADATAAYTDAAFWEGREDDAHNLAVYAGINFLDGKILPPDATVGEVLVFFDEHDEELAARRKRRLDYIRFRQAEADLNLGQPTLARPALEAIQAAVGERRRESLLRVATDEAALEEMAPNVFELGPDDYVRLDLLLARTYDELGQEDQARAGYLRYLSNAAGGRHHAFVIERLAAIAMDNGEVYRRIDAARAAEAYGSAAGYYEEIASTPSATREQRDAALLGSALANSRLAELVPDAPKAGVDDLADAGRTIRSWLENFSGQVLPRRTLALPEAAGKALSTPELLLPGPLALPSVVSGTLAAMAGGALETPYELRRRHNTVSLKNYDMVADMRAGTEAGDRAAVQAAWKNWLLGNKAETETRFEAMLDPLSSEELTLAGRIGLATVALDRGDLRRARMLVLGGYSHPSPLWFTVSDADWRKIATLLGNPALREGNPSLARLWEALPEEAKDIASYAASGRRLEDDYVNRFITGLNAVLRRRELYAPESFPIDAHRRNFYLAHLLARDPERLTDDDVVWRNRLLLEGIWPYDISQKAAKDNVGFLPLPSAIELPPGGLIDPEQIRILLLDLAAAWNARAADLPLEDRLRAILESVDAYQAALDKYRGNAGEILYEQARNYESLADIREAQGKHIEALSLTAAAARNYFDVSLKDRGSPREMDALLAAGDAFFRSGLLERTVETQKRFLDRFGYVSLPGGDAASQVVRAENLLGRAYWFLNDVPNAIASFTRNIPRRTPDRFKSMYYIGRVLMEEGASKDRPELLGSDDQPLPALNRDGDPAIDTALQAFNYLRQSPAINPTARAWRWATFDLASLKFIFAERARREWEAEQPATPADQAVDAQHAPWLPLYDEARTYLTEALARYPLRRNGGVGISVRVEPEDYADVMASRFEAEYLLAKTLLILSEARDDRPMGALARTHLANLADRNRYAGALFDRSFDRFQQNAAVIREEVEGGNWDKDEPLPRTRLGDDEGPTHSPQRMRDLLRNGLQLLAYEYFKAGDAAAATEGGQGEAEAYYRQAYTAYQDVYDRFGAPYGALAMLGMGDSLARMGRADDAANHYRMAENIANLLPGDTRSDGLLDMGPAFWGQRAGDRLNDMAGGYTVP